ncbi:MAG: methyltransferase domain-containing protein [Gallionella sp.]|nr:methyltransferase domain-containing protein [Gallionella sp.]
MIKPNNPQIDSALLDEKITWVVDHRRRAEALIMPDERKRFQAQQGAMAARMKTHLKTIPIIGIFLKRAFRLWRKLISPGLGWRTRVRLLPWIGTFAQWVYSLVRLGRFRSQTLHELMLLRQHIDEMQRQLESYRSESLTAADRLQSRVYGEMQRVDGEVQRVGGEVQRVDGEVQRVESQQGNRLADLTVAAGSLERRLIKISSAASEQEGKRSLLQEQETGNTLPPSFYLLFENHFRGDRESIKSRLRAYLPYLSQMASGRARLQVLDIGCGRGEWLELLSEAGYAASGVDQNEEMAEHCHMRGLVVEHGDALAHLSRLQAESLDVVSAFHVIEHLPLESLVVLFDEVLRVLRPSGMAIFETPNPENLQVGACNFYYDPTHLHPIPPPVAQFLAFQRGFARADILRINPYPDSFRVAEENELARRFNDLIYGPQDYALLAHKHHEN